MPNSISPTTLQNLQSAEGYLELGSMFDDRWTLELPLRRVMSDSAMYHLNLITDPRGHASRVLYLKGQACRLAERYGQAIEWFDAVIDLEPDNLHALLAVAWCHKRNDHLMGSIEAMERAIEEEPGSAIAHYNLACYLALDAQVDACVTRLAEAFDLEPQYRVYVADESDFDAVRDHAAFQSLIDAGVSNP
jgi:tetratricopeptide (TPR) repeat protein